MLRLCLVIGVLAATSTARAERKPLGEGLDIVVDNGNLEVRKGKERYRLAPANALASIKVDAKQRHVDLTVEDYTCEGTHTFHFGFDQLAARLENAAAFRLHVAKDWKTAAVGFARAAALDPAWNIPAYNLASAKALLGDSAGALQALAPWLASAPVATYIHVASDPELVALLDQPPLLALRSAKPGATKISASGIKGDIAVSLTHSLLAIARTEGSWGSCMFERRLEVYDTKSGAMVATTPIVPWNDTDPDCGDQGLVNVPAKRPVTAARVAALQAMLDQLGFVRATTEAATVTNSSIDTEEKQLGNFDKAKLGLVVKNRTARVLRKNDVLATATVLDRLESAQLVAEANVLVVFTNRPGREGCEGTDPTLISVLPVAPKTP